MSDSALPKQPPLEVLLDKFVRGAFVKASPEFIQRFNSATTNHPELKSLIEGGVAFITTVIKPSVYIGEYYRYLALNPKELIFIPDCKISPERIAERDAYFEKLDKAVGSISLSDLIVG